MYNSEKNYDKLKNNGYTFFLNPKDQIELKGRVKKNEYDIYYPTKDSEKVIFYTKTPDISLYEIKTNNTLRHQDILGSLFNLGIDESTFGDIIINNNHYYIFIVNVIEDYLLSTFKKIGKYSIELVKLDINFLEDYERSYEELELIVSSERIDSVVSKIIKSNRNIINDLIKDKDILLNYNYLKKKEYKLRDGDIFSIRKYGKYKYMGIKNTTKSGNLIIVINKYI